MNEKTTRGNEPRYCVRRRPEDMWEGPFPVSTIRKMVVDGKLASDASVCLEDGEDWVSLDEMSDQPVERKPKKLIASEKHGAPGPGAAESGAARYKNLHTVSGSLRAYGGIVKGVGIVLGIAGVGGGFTIHQTAIGLVVIGAGIFLGVFLHATGTVIAAMGEGLLALADIATNTAADE